MRYLSKDDLVKTLVGAAELLDRYGRRKPDSLEKGLEPLDALAFSYVICRARAAREKEDLRQLLGELAVKTSDYHSFREAQYNVTTHKENIGAAVLFYTGLEVGFYRTTSKKLRELAEKVKSK